MTVAIMLVILFVAIVGVLIGSLGFRAIRSATQEQTPQVDGDVLGARVESFVGGARWPFGNATYPLARLDFHEYGVRVHGAVRLLDRVVPDWRSTYKEIRAAQPVEAPARLGTGLRLQQEARNSWIVFWATGRVDDLVARLASMGVPATTERQRISFWTGYDA